MYHQQAMRAHQAAQDYQENMYRQIDEFSRKYQNSDKFEFMASDEHEQQDLHFEDSN